MLGMNKLTHRNEGERKKTTMRTNRHRQSTWTHTQGSVLSPFLFAIYLDDVAALCRPESKLFIINIYYTIRYILLLAPTLTALQKLLHACEHELCLIDMAVNFNNCSRLRVGQRYDVVCADIAI